MGSVTVADDLYDAQGQKVVTTAEGRVREVAQGQSREPGEQLLAVDGEPAFRVSFEQPIQEDTQVPDEVGLALRRVAARLYRVTFRGREVTADEETKPELAQSLPVEGVFGPTVFDGGLCIGLDTDGKGFTQELIEAMAGIFVEELTPLGVQAHLSAAASRGCAEREPWRSSVESQDA